MKIEKYYNTNYIPKKYIPSLIDAEIECWGSRPFGEFLKCINSKCGINYSIEDVYGDIQTYLNNKKNNKIFFCSKCNSLTRHIYEKEEFTQLAIKYVKQKVNLILLINKSDNIRGFGVLTKTNLINLVNIEFNTREQSYNKNELLSLISKNIFDSIDLPKQHLICFHQLFVGEELRGKGFGKKITNQILKLAPEHKNLPILIETKKESNFYYTAKKLGFIELTNDKYGYIIMFLKQNFKNLNY